MAFQAIVVASLLALASAGMPAGMMNMNQQQMMQQMQGMMGQMNQGHSSGGHSSGGGCANGNCMDSIPKGVDLAQYMQQQKEQQAYESQQMAEKIKARFEAIMYQVTTRKHRYAMSLMTEFVSMCSCAESSYNIYQTMFVNNAKLINMTDVVDLNDWAKMKPYEAKNSMEAKEMIFAGTLNSMCTEMAKYMDFVTLVEQEVNRLQGNNIVTPAPVGK